MTYVEGASLHQDRGGSTVFARYAFNELVSFVAGWAILLDYVILIAVTAYSATQYLQRVLGAPRRQRRGARARARVHRAGRARATSAASARSARAPRRRCCSPATSRCRRFIVVLGLVLFFNPHTLLDPIHLGSAPTWSNLIFALTVAVVAFTSLESASGLVGRGAHQPRRAQAAGRRARPRRSPSCTSASRWWPSRRCPSHGGHTAARRRATSNAPMIGIVDAGAPALARADARVPGRGPGDA